jgi:hypothetical protein
VCEALSSKNNFLRKFDRKSLEAREIMQRAYNGDD